MTFSRFAFPAGLTALLLCASCTDKVVVDDDFGEITRRDDPRIYPRGAEVRLTARWDDYETVGAWQATTADPGVLSIVDAYVESSRLVMTAVANGAGTTNVIVFDDEGDLVHVPVRVADVDSIHLVDHALQRVEASSEDVGPDLRVVQGYAAALEIRYLVEGGDRALAFDLLQYPERDFTQTDPPPLDVWTDRDFDDGEFLLVQANELGTHYLDLSVPDGTTRTLRVTAVAPDEISTLSVTRQDESEAETGKRICMAVLATDDIGRRVYAPPAEWKVDGLALARPQPLTLDRMGPADLACYDYEPDLEPATVVAEVSGTSVATEARGQLFVTDSSADIGCAVGGGGASASWLLVLAAAVFALGRRRKER